MLELSYRTLTKEVFDPPKIYQSIIKILAQKGPLNLSRITDYAYETELSHLKRWGIKNVIYGSKRKRGMMSYDYLIEKYENKHRWKKQEKSYHLTLKGMIVSLQFVPPKRNYFFKKFSDFVFWFEVAKKVNRDKWQPFVEDYILAQINLFLSYNFLNGIQLTRKIDFSSYFSDFFRDIHGMDLTIPNLEDKIAHKGLENIVSKYAVLHTALQILSGDVGEMRRDSFVIRDLTGSLDIQKELKGMNQSVRLWYPTQAIIGEDGISDRRRRKYYPSEFSANNLVVKIPVSKILSKLKELGYEDLANKIVGK